MASTRWRTWAAEVRDKYHLRDGTPNQCKQRLCAPVSVTAGRGYRRVDVNDIRLPEAALASATMSSVGFGRGKKSAPSADHERILMREQYNTAGTSTTKAGNSGVSYSIVPRYLGSMVIECMTLCNKCE